jgi:hypothetical protein
MKEKSTPDLIVYLRRVSMCKLLLNTAVFVLLAILSTPQQASADTAPPKIGVVVMHGKGGGPNRLYEPDASHVSAPTASKEEILRWMKEIAAVQ